MSRPTNGEGGSGRAWCRLQLPVHDYQGRLKGGASSTESRRLLIWRAWRQPPPVIACAAAPQGLGKTLQTISLLGYLREFRGITGPHMVRVWGFGE